MPWYPLINTGFHNLISGSFIFSSSGCTTKLICWLISFLTYIIDWYNQFYGTTDGWNLVSFSSLQPVSWWKLLSAQVQCELTLGAEKTTVTNLEFKTWMIFMWRPFTNILLHSHRFTVTQQSIVGMTETVTYCSTNAGVRASLLDLQRPKMSVLGLFLSPAELMVIAD